MPNHVNNYLSVQGDKNLIADFFAKAKGKNAYGNEEDFTFNSFIPMPENIYRDSIGEREKLEFMENNWYDWSLKNWGTKWDCYRYEVYPDKSLVSFQTAWSAPIPVLIEISKQFPTLKFTDEYIEETVESAGEIVCVGGQLLQHTKEGYGDWANCKSFYIHNLNMKHNQEYYLSYLEEMSEDDQIEDYYSHYLSLAKSAKV